IGLERAADARVNLSRRQHEVLDDELAAPGKEVAELLLAGGAVKYVRLIDPHPGQCAPLIVEPVAEAGQLFFLFEQRAPRRVPFVAGDDLMIHRSISSQLMLPAAR